MAASQNFGEVRHDAGGHLRLVHGVDVDVADAVGEQVDDLLRGIDDAGLPHGGGRLAEVIHDGAEALRHVGAGHGHAAAQLAGAGDGHDAGDDRHEDAPLPHAIEKVVEYVVVEEHLGRQKIKPGVHLLLQVIDVLALVRALDVSLRIAGPADAEIAVGADIPDQLHGVFVVGGNRAVRGPVAAQGEYILDALLTVGLQHIQHVPPAGGHAGQVGQRGHAVFGLNFAGDAGGKFPGAAARAVGDGHEVGLQRGDLLRGGGNLGVFVRGLRREYLQRKRNVIALQQLGNPHDVALLSD